MDEEKARVAATSDEDPREPSDDAVGLPPNVRDTLSSILAHAASQERTVIELRTDETAAGRTHFTTALEITEHVAELEAQVGEDSPAEDRR